MIRTPHEEDRLADTAKKYMRYKLALNSKKPHWLTEDLEILKSKLQDELVEFREAVFKTCANPSGENLEALNCEAADVSNMLWMISDWITEHMETKVQSPQEG